MVSIKEIDTFVVGSIRILIPVCVVIGVLLPTQWRATFILVLHLIANIDELKSADN